MNTIAQRASSQYLPLIRRPIAAHMAISRVSEYVLDADWAPRGVATAILDGRAASVTAVKIPKRTMKGIQLQEGQTPRTQRSR